MAEDERQVRLAVESLLSGSINSQRSSCSQPAVTRPADIVLNEDLIAGAMQNGRMSNVRRFFCLFITFDLLLTFLMWLICTMIAGESLKTAFLDQVVHYHIKTSLFDIVMAAVSRFVVLLLFYALLYLNHWVVVAISTAVTSAFLLAKVFLFDWSVWNQPVFLVLLILSSFVLAWAEAWFLDFRVLPQEIQARNFFGNFAVPERAPLLSNFMPDSHQYNTVEPSGTFFTPMDSPDHSDHEEDVGRRGGNARRLSKGGETFISKPLPKLNAHEVEDYKSKASTLMAKCHDLLVSKDWKVESEGTNGDMVLYIDRPKPEGRIVKIVGVVDAPANFLVDRLFEEIETSPSWNKFVTESTKLQEIDKNTDIVYQATSAAAGGLVDARDFVILRHRNKCGDFYISSGISVQLSSLPRRDRVIRGENGVGCWAAEELPDDPSRCRFTWILNTNLNGWLPQKIVDKTKASVLKEFMVCLRKHVESNRWLA